MDIDTHIKALRAQLATALATANLIASTERSRETSITITHIEEAALRAETIAGSFGPKNTLFK